MATMASMFELVPRATSSNAGSHQNAGPNSVSGMLSTLIPSFLVACLLMGFFLILRPKIQRIYMPRTYLGVLSQHQKTPKVSSSLFAWIPEFMRLDDAYVLNHHSLDAYLFLRFWKRIILVTGLGWPITWIVLMPIYGTAHGGEQQFDKISFSNIDAGQDSYRLYGVTFVAWIVLGAIMYVIGRECLFCVKLKQAYLRAPGIATRIASRTVLFTGVLTLHAASERTLRDMFPSVKTVWTVRDTEELDDLLEDRDKAVNKLEGALVKMSKLANDRRRKLDKTGDKEAQEDVVHWVDEKKPVTHRLKPIIGKKVDTVPWCEEQFQKLNPRITSLQNAHREGKTEPLSAVFIEFETVEAAEAAFHRTKIGGMTNYSPRTVGSRPDEIIWKNLGMNKTQRMIRTAAAIAVICVMTIFWGPITAFIGAVSNINSLTNLVPFLSFINDIPPQILGVVTGLLPALLLAILMVLVPIIMRVLFKLAGAVTLSEVELKTQTWYFVFQVIQVFLITTLSSGAAATVTRIIQNPSQATNLLASNLPKASNFYINYFVLYGLALAAKSLFNIIAVLLYFILGKFLDKTPRKMYNRYINIAGLKWGSLYPKFTNLAVIAITYSCISPLVLAFATIGFVFLGYAFRYSLMYSVDVTSMNTNGRAYTKALQQLTTGVYLSELCLIGLMGIATGSSSAAIGPLVLMIVFLVATVIFHILLNRAISSLSKDVASDFNEQTAPQETKEQIAVHENPKHHSKVTGKAGEKNASFFVRIMRLPALPTFSEYLETPMPEYTEEDRKEAYMNPSITAPPPLIWIAHDNVGMSEREMKSTAKHVEVTDKGAWWDEKSGKLTTVWSGKEHQDGENVVREAPIWKPKVHY